MKRSIISGLSRLALTAIGVEMTLMAIAINHVATIKNEAIATRHRDSSLPNPTSFEKAIAAN
jgi:hypothetical protein